ncbi:charged multivesicular body protein 7 isoform X4 [Poecile atricapillus]|uniref:charged multivesicular body protein 7 isoform X4 n=1 Tax=Poecile atricapillus TaxID=48891 RepID=UPI0027392DA1|nr:charged multivesicular body protein 7 isoform X4 [Poecile atricapillus]
MCSPGEAPPGLAPAGDLPPEWETDDERMAFLFSAFKQSREVNSTEWDSKMAFWVGLVLARGRRRGAVRTCLRELQNGFERRGSVPLGLGTVLRELLRRGKLQRESDFMASVDSSWISWGVGVFILKPLKWTLSSVLGDSKIPEEEEVLIYVELLQEKAEEVYRLYQNSALSSHPVVALSELRSLCAGLCPDERTFYLLLLQLQKEKRVTILEQNGEKVQGPGDCFWVVSSLSRVPSARREMDFGHFGGSSGCLLSGKIVKFARGLHAKVSPMNDVDIGVYQLMQSEQLLSQKVESLSQEAEKCKEDARSACRAGKKQLVFNAYQAGVGALKLSMKDVTVERAENLVDQIQELCDTQDEVAQTLAGVGINGLAEVDSEELEKELDSLLQDSSKDSVDLPPVPQMVPSARVSDAELEAELEQLSVSAGDLAQKTPSASSEPKTALGLNL